MNILQMSLLPSLLIAVIVGIRRIGLHRLPKKVFSALWGVALVRLLLPVSIPFRFSFDTLLNRLQGVLEWSYQGTVSQASIFLPAEKRPAATVQPFQIIWIVGLCALVLFFGVAYIRLFKEFKISLPIENGPALRWLEEHSIRRKVKIRQNDRITSPLTYGIISPVILLPKRIEWGKEAELSYILTHEMAHIRYFHGLVKLLLAAALCIYWFNPLVWLMCVLANRDMELACDEIVVHTFGEEKKSAYALALIKWEENRMSFSPSVLYFSENVMKERIVSIMKMKKISLIGIVMSFALVAVISIVFATNAKGDGAVPDITAEEVESRSAFEGEEWSLVGVLVKDPAMIPQVPKNAGAMDWLSQEALTENILEQAGAVHREGREKPYREIHVITTDMIQEWTRITGNIGGGKIQSVDMPDLPEGAEIKFLVGKNNRNHEGEAV